MPRKDTPEELLARLDWVRRLPESVWSQGIVGTAEYVCDEISGMKEEKATLDQKIKSRMQALRLMSSRAEREACLMYEAEDVELARDPVDGNVTAPSPEIGVVAVEVE